MSGEGTGARVFTAAAKNKIQKVEPAAEAESSNVNTSSPAIGKWPWWATLLIAIVLLVVWIVFKSLLWSYASGADAALEGSNFDQLKQIADDVQAVVTLLVGGIFGVGATQGVAAGAAKAAEDNKATAERINEIANKNAEAARTNGERSNVFEAVTTDLATAVARYKQVRQSDDSRFIPAFRGLASSAGSIQVPESSVATYDAELDQMASDCERILEKLR